MNRSTSRLVAGGVVLGHLMPGSLLLPFSPKLAAQAVVTGTVRQDSSRRALSGVEVLLEKPKRHTVTDAEGRFAIEGVPNGDRVILYRSVGYRPVRVMVRVSGADTVQADALLVPFAVPLEPIKVTAPAPSASMMGLSGFEERRRLGLGLFIDSAELRRNEQVRLGDLMGRLNGVQIQRTRESSYAVSLGRVGPFGERCPMSIIVDGAVIYRSTGIQIHTKVPLPPPPETPPDLNSILGVSDLSAVEIYRKASEVPIEFGGKSAACGAIVLWTRRAR